MVAKDYPKAIDTSRVEVGEIDTRSPISSVKDAVSLFGEVSSPLPYGEQLPVIIRKSKPHSAESVYAKDTQLHLARKELNKLKAQLKNAEMTKAQAHQELEKAKATLEDLTQKLNYLSEAKNSAVRATEAAREQAKQLEESVSTANGTNSGWKQELETSREQYIAAVTELNAAKQGLRKIRQDFDATFQEKDSALKQAAQAEDTAKANKERVNELSIELTAVKDSFQEVKLATMQSHQDQMTIHADKDGHEQFYKVKLDKSAVELLTLKNKIDPELIQNLESQLIETESEIGTVKNQVANAKACAIDTAKNITTELDEAKESLQKVAQDEYSLRSLVDSLKLELENVKKEHLELKEKEAETESVAENLHVKLRKCKSELDAVTAEESRVLGASEEMMSSLRQLISDSENARHEAEEMKKKAEEMKKEVEATRLVLEETEQRLMAALDEANEAKAAETRTLEEVKMMSDNADMSRGLSLEPGNRITISREEFESLSRKVEESDKLAEMKVTAVMAQVEAVKASENESTKKLEATQKEIEDMKAATREALEKAQTAEAAKKAVEGELRRWREREQKKVAETASRILAETEMASRSSSPTIQQQEAKSVSLPILRDQKKEKGGNGMKRLEKAKTSLSRKVFLPSLSIFHRKKSHVEDGSPSYLPGEKPV